MQRLLGILGGMGPLATVDFMTKIIEATPAHCDQDHVPVITCSLPQIPDRTEALVAGGPSPLAAMIDGVRRLEHAGADAVAIPCNTAHHWHGAIQADTCLPVFHIADAAIEAIHEDTTAPCVGLLATSGTASAGIYETRLAAKGVAQLLPTPEEQDALVMKGIRLVKGGNPLAGGQLLAAAADALVARGADRIILACTEIPPAMNAVGCNGEAYVDATDALARACVDWSLGTDRADLKRAA